MDAQLDRIASPSPAGLGEDAIRRLLELAPDGVFVASPQGRYTYANGAAARMLGYSREELVGMHIRELIPPGDSDRLERSRQLMCEGGTHVDEWELRHKDGRWIPVEVSANILPDGQWQAFVRDLTARRKLEQQVRGNERLLDAVFELLPVGVWVADRDGNILRSNPAGRAVWGGERKVGPADYGLYKAWREDSGEPVAAHERGMARAVLNGETSTGEILRIQAFDGSMRTIIHSAAPLRGPDGSIMGGIAINDDITALFEAQRRQLGAEALFRTVFDLAPVGLYVADAEGRITHGNAAGERIWQGLHKVGPEQFGHYRAWWLDSGKAIAPDEWAVARAVRRGETSHGELIRIQCFDGSFKTILNWAAPLLDAGGRVTGAVAVNQDVTALHQAQEQLRAAVREREKLLAVVAHDLRNPLNVIMLRAAMAGRKFAGMPGVEECRTAAATIFEAAGRMAGLVEDLLAISVADSGRSLLKLEPVQPQELLAAAAREAQPLFSDAGLRLEIQAIGELPVIQSDQNRLLRVFGNLLDNALKFTGRGGQVVIRAEAADDSVLFSVANSGPALPREDLESLFRPFWQAGTDGRGAGLGLSICRSIIEAHGGSVWAEPAPGMRVKVLFLLPRLGSHATATPPAPG
ncbi:sensor histidine kinase [Ramlibacter sp.]|uniref:sensor histidine kinase n=1 Tax=Ramlibacter sp. TaxID=1917967 RepID=UPI002FC76006